MPVIKTPKKFNFRTNLGLFLILLPWFVGTVLIAENINMSNLMLLIQILWFAAMCVALIYWLVQRKKDFVCPDCGTPVPETVKNSGTDGEPIMHYCKKCDVLWHMGNIPSSG